MTEFELQRIVRAAAKTVAKFGVALIPPPFLELLDPDPDKSLALLQSHLATVGLSGVEDGNEYIVITPRTTITLN